MHITKIRPKSNQWSDTRNEIKEHKSLGIKGLQGWPSGLRVLFLKSVNYDSLGECSPEKDGLR